MTVYEVNYNDGIFNLKEVTLTKGGQATTTLLENSPDHNFTDAIKSAFDNETRIEEHLIDVEKKAKILNEAIQAYKKAEQVARENKTTQNDENNKSFDESLNKIKESINKIEGGKRKTFRKKNKKNKKGKKNNSKNKHNNRL